MERSFELILDRGGLRHTWLRGRGNVQKRSTIQVAAYNLGLIMRQLVGAGTPREALARAGMLLWLLDPYGGLVAVLILPTDAAPEPTSATAGEGRAKDARAGVGHAPSPARPPVRTGGGDARA